MRCDVGAVLLNQTVVAADQFMVILLVRWKLRINLWR